MNELKRYIEAFSSLHTAKVKGYKAPHKAVLLLAVIDLIEENVITGPEIELTNQLVERFDAIWYRYLGMSSIFTPDICKPYFHMQHEKFWRLVEHNEANVLMAAEPSLQVASNKETKRLPVGSYSVKAMRSTFAHAEIDHTLYMLLRSNDARAMLRVVLINTYLSNQPTKTLPDFASIIMVLPLIALIA